MEMQHTYQRPDEGHCFKMSCYWSCCLGAHGCISHHGKTLVSTKRGKRLHILGKTGRGQAASVFFKHAPVYQDEKVPEGIFVVSPATLRFLLKR